MGILQVFGHFLKKFCLGDRQIWYADTLWIPLNVCKRWCLSVKFSGRFWPRIGPKWVNLVVFVYLLEKFPLDSH